MYELIQAGPCSYYVQCPSKVGLVVTGEGEAVLIDSGSGKDAARKVLRILETNGWRLRAIFNTHSHADHIGGNAFLQERTGCPVYAPGIECAFTEFPVLEPALLYGSCPPEELRHKFLMAAPSRPQPLADEALPQGLQIVHLPGHSFEMVGFRSPDDVVYLADCLSSREILDKYQIAFVHDVGAFLETLERVKELRARLFVPSHAPATEDIAPLAQYNIDKVREIAGRIADLCGAPLTFEELLQKLFTAYELTMNFDQYALVGSTLRAYLTWMQRTGLLCASFEENRMLWRRA